MAWLRVPCQAVPYCATLLRLTTVWTVPVAYEIRLCGNAFKALLIDGSGVLGNGTLRENRKRHWHLYSQTKGKGHELTLER
jgi:hypothetical protein